MKNQILNSWDDNADEWIRLIEKQAIPSRKITNDAVIGEISKHQVSKICDVGCGEGWLVRSLIERGISAEGIDGTTKLVERAKKTGKGQFHTQSFEEIVSTGKLEGGVYDSAVLNFCLYEESGSADLLKTVIECLVGAKLIFIQSLHPANMISRNVTYRDQWLGDSWKGLEGNFTSTHQWYCRTLSGWFKLFDDVGLKLVSLTEPCSSDNKQPLSIIFTLTDN